MRGCKIKLYPTREQAQRIREIDHAQRFIWNWGLAQRRDHYQHAGWSLSSYPLSAMLTNLKTVSGYEWLKDIDSHSLQTTLRTQDQAYKNFFDGLKRRRPDRPGLPRFKRRKLISSGSYKPAPHNVKLEYDRVRVPKVGWVKIRGLRKEFFRHGKYKSVTIHHSSDDTYTASVLFDVPDHLIKEPRVWFTEPPVGIDMGIKTWIAESTGRQIHQIDLSKEALKMLRLQEKKNKTRRGSSNRKKIQKKMNRLHQRVKNKKTDQIERVTHEYRDRIVIREDLRVRDMSKKKRGKKNLNRLNMSQNWYQFFMALSRKTRVIAVDPRFTSQTCSMCGYVDKGNRENQAFHCLSCGYATDADYNASINILNRGMHGDCLEWRSQRPDLSRVCLKTDTSASVSIGTKCPALSFV